MKLSDTIALVTGGASGLGEATTRMLVAEGGRVAIVDLPTSRGAEIAAELGSGTVFLPTDVRVVEEVQAAVDGTVEALGGLNLVVNAAGIAPRNRLITRSGRLHSEEVFRNTIDINLVGPWNVARLSALQMTSNDPGPDGERGVIVNVASIAALEGDAGQTAYSASKAGIAGLILPMARDLAAHGIRVNAISPGLMDTPMLAEAPPEYLASLLEAVVFPKRPGRPDEFAHAVRFIVENTLLNGEILRLDAGKRIATKS